MKSLRDALGRAAYRNLPGLRERWARGFAAVEAGDVPFARLAKPLAECRVALVTTAGVHHADQPAFDMRDADGDASLRVLDTTRDDLAITHDYYDHRDADRDIDVVLPVHRLREAAERDVIGAVHVRAWSFMGHLLDAQLEKLIRETGPEAARQLAADAVDAVLLTPA